MWTKITQSILALAAVIAAAVSIYNSFKIESVHVSINSRMDQMLILQGVASKAEGVSQERARKNELPH